MHRATQRRGGRSFVAVVVLSWVLSWALSWSVHGTAHAGVSLQAAVTAAAGVTDNVASAPTAPVAGTVGRQSDFELLISPSLILSGGTARAVQTLQYTFGGIVYGAHSEADSYTNTLTYNGFYLPSKRTRLGISAALNQGQLSSFNTAIPSTGQTNQTQVSGTQDVLTINANQTFAADIAPQWFFTEFAGYSKTYSLSAPVGPIAQAAPASLRLERDFQHSAIALAVDGTFTNYAAQLGNVLLPNGAVNPNGTVVPEQNQYIVTPTLQYRRDLTYWLSTRLNGGASIVFDPTNVSAHYVTPAGGAALNFLAARVNFDLSYQHSIAPNLLVSSNFINDAVAARGTFLLSQRYHFTLAASVSYLYSRELDLQNHPEGHSQTILADATLAYTPFREVSFFLRYQLIDQIGQPNTNAVVNSVNVFDVESLYRNTLLFGITAIYPVQAAVQVPGNTVGVRADHTDDARIDVSKSTPP